MQRIVPSLWFDTQAEEAAKFYTSVFRERFQNSRIKDYLYYGEGAPFPAGTVLTVSFELAGQEYVALNGGPIFKFTEAVSLMVQCENQEEIDYFWEALSAGGEKSQCGWLKDRYGLSWQVTPVELEQMLRDADKAKAQRAMEAMLGMRKLDIAALRKAYEGR